MGRPTNRATLEEGGVRYVARSSGDPADRRNFTITVKPAAVNPEAAANTGRYQATRYCILTYGGSDKEWSNGPDVPIEELQIVDDTLTMQGRCTQR